MISEEPLTGYNTASFLIVGVTFGFGIPGIFGNLLSILAFVRKCIKSSVAILLIGLAVSDMMVIVLALLTFAFMSLQPLFSTSDSAKRSTVFMAYYSYPLVMTFHTASILLITVISCERFISILRPLRARIISTPENSRRALAYTFIFAATFNFIRFFEYRIVRESQFNVTFLSGDLKENKIYRIVYGAGCYSLVHFVVPISIILTTHISIVRTIRRAHKTRRSMRSNRQSTRVSKEYKIAKMIIVLVLVFLALNTTPSVLNFIEAIKPGFFTNPRTKDIGYLLMDLGNSLAVLNSSINFLIYFASNPRFRLACMHALCSFPNEPKSSTRRYVLQNETAPEEHIELMDTTARTYRGSL